MSKISKTESNPPEHHARQVDKRTIQQAKKNPEGDEPDPEATCMPKYRWLLRKTKSGSQKKYNVGVKTILFLDMGGKYLGFGFHSGLKGGREKQQPKNLFTGNGQTLLSS